MKTKTFFRVLAMSAVLLFVCGTTNAQVTIGDEKAPEEFSVLELTGGDKGLRLPQLNNSQRVTLADKLTGNPEAEGLLIYNTDTGCIELWTGTEWIAKCDGIGVNSSLPAITEQPKNVYVRRNRTANNWLDTAPKLKFQVLGKGNVSYKWYKANGDELNVPSASTNQLDIDEIKNDINIQNWGEYSYYCVATDAQTNIQLTSNNAYVFVSCWAMTGNGANDWLAFMCHNVGASMSVDPFTPSQDTHGSWYRWNTRYPCANQSSSIGAITSWELTTPPRAESWHQYDNPCPNGWRLPSKQEWNNVINNNAATYTQPQGLWDWEPTTNNQNFATGVSIGPTLFLPAAGYREGDYGQLNGRGFRGIYHTVDGYALDIYYERMVLAGAGRVYGFSVRCVAE